MTNDWPVPIETLRPIASGAMLWRRSERVSLTIIAKATLRLVPDGVSTLMQPVELLRQEKVLGAGPSLYADTDLVPYKPRVDVVYVGNAWAPRPVQALRARLGVMGTAGTLEKTVQVVGERLNATVQPAPFYRIPITWDRAQAGPKGENPLGVTARTGRMPNLFDVRDPNLAVGLGAVSPRFPARRALLGAFDLKALETPAPPPNSGDVWSIHVPPTLPFEFFQSAPADQQLDLLTGSESLWLENLVEGTSRMHTELPAIKALARVFGASIPPQGQTLELTADTLLIDGVEKQATITFRGTVPVPATESLVKTLHVLTTIEMPHMPAQWPSSVGRATAKAEPARGLPQIVEEPTPMWDDDEGGGSTKAISPEAAMAMIQARMGARPLPFGQPPPPPPPAPPPPPSAPAFAPEPAPMQRPSSRKPSMSAAQPLKEERTLSPAEADALRQQLLGKSMEDEPSAPPETTRLAPAGLDPRFAAPPHLQQPYRAPSPQPVPQARPPSQASMPAVGSAPQARPPSQASMPAVGPAPSMPAVSSTPQPYGSAQSAPSFGAPPPTGQRSGPDLVLRSGAPPLRSGPADVHDEDSSIGSTMAITPEAAAALLANRPGAMPLQPHPPAAPSRQPTAPAASPQTAPMPPPAGMPQPVPQAPPMRAPQPIPGPLPHAQPMPPPAPMPPAPQPSVMPRPQFAPMPPARPNPTVNDEGESTGATMALSPEAAAAIMEKQKAEILRRKQEAEREEQARKAAQKPASPPEDPSLPRQNTLVMEIPPELGGPPKRR